ncbi:hypothetical protein [Microbispora sp. NBC_01389]
MSIMIPPTSSTTAGATQPTPKRITASPVSAIPPTVSPASTPGASTP